jgi:hypothetical protein
MDHPIAPDMRKPFWTLLLPLLLLFAQQAELRHEYSHHAGRTASCKKPVPADTCSTCLACAHVTAAAKPEVTFGRLLSNLSFHFAPATQVAHAGDNVASPRNRGPPTL